MEKNIFNDENQKPAENLLHELNMRLCNVGVLCTLLEECNLLMALSIFRHPGKKKKLFIMFPKKAGRHFEY